MDKRLLLFVLKVVSPSLVTGCVEVVVVGLSEEGEVVGVDDKDANVGLVED